MDTWDALRARRNVRTYADRPIPEDQLDRILEAADPRYVKLELDAENAPATVANFLLRERRRSQTAATEFCKIDGQRACPLVFVPNRQFRRMQRLSRQKQSPIEFRRPTGFDKLKIKLLGRSINFVAHNRMAERTKMHADLMSSSSTWNRADQTEFVA